MNITPDLLRSMTLLGMKNAEVAETLGMSKALFDNWCHVRPEWKAALKRGRVLADARAAEALYRRAIGYDVQEQRGEAIVTRHVPPDAKAAIRWLERRQPALWRKSTPLRHFSTISFEQAVRELNGE